MCTITVLVLVFAGGDYEGYSTPIRRDLIERVEPDTMGSKLYLKGSRQPILVSQRPVRVHGMPCR